MSYEVPYLFVLVLGDFRRFVVQRGDKLKLECSDCNSESEAFWTGPFRRNEALRNGITLIVPGMTESHSGLYKFGDSLEVVRVYVGGKLYAIFKHMFTENS